MVNLLIGCTGSVATTKIPELIAKFKLKIENVSVRLVTTNNAKHFIDLDKVDIEVYQDIDEWENWSEIGDPILHIDLRNWADLFLIAPLDANTLGKLAHGICDNLLTLIARAWEIDQKPLVFCPAMNTSMWKHPSTNINISILKQWNYIEIPPIYKKLACGDEGVGAMETVDNIVTRIASFIN